jgi:transcription antitermination factor NusG
MHRDHKAMPNEDKAALSDHKASLSADKDTPCEDKAMPSENKEYGCVYCKAGLEAQVARQLRDAHEGLAAYYVTQIKHKSAKGVKSQTQATVFPGYVFFEADPDCPISGLKHTSNVLRLLLDSEDHWRLHGDNRAFARWVIEHRGVIGMSKAYQEGTLVVFQSGPLKDYTGTVVRVDRHSRNGLVEIRFDDHVFRIWMAFEMVSPA